jgi:hypothetical protein
MDGPSTHMVKNKNIYLPYVTWELCNLGTYVYIYIYIYMGFFWPPAIPFPQKDLFKREDKIRYGKGVMLTKEKS